MKPSRRDFIKNSAILGTGLILTPFDTFGLAAEARKFLDRLGISTSIKNNSILASAGYSFVEENVQGFLIPLKPDSEFEENMNLVKASRLPVEACNSFLPGNLKCVGPTPVHEEILKYADVAFKRAKMVGVKTIVFGSGGARRIPDNFSREKAKAQFISLCKQLAPVAKKYDVVITMEPLNTKECNFINSVAEGAEIVEAVNHKNFRLLADIYHMLMENESPSNITKYGHLLYHTHIAEKVGRTSPGVSNDDFRPYFKALKDVKYKGRMAIECSWKDIEVQAGEAITAMRTQLASI